ncbi:hypothetical protein PC116_g29641 [Phytophthora cactorum]|uniref:Uncharacterized protein n=1 Tax=Phytophthora cactorum TaxID=29920 RepID=A0A8T1A5X4_9STRA|nr:hypothetical protein PC111_g24288 [Phytophthora cactorum]KAG2790302.1 hypothetical protein PC112_g24393 [Phytophthora cactorum]KAG2805351.1 hypothetical protein PC113_g24240 [Phytophthora cactorum]KAG2870774.1 hypothetical protein PC114_g27228 [Phytophthora cactorum]KAG2873423.1 hypothetical protein PC115_g24371 [Phytophthora cactorum]
MCALGRRCGSLKVLGFFAACTVGNVHNLYALLQISPANYADPMHCVNEVAADFQCMLPPPGAAEHPGRLLRVDIPNMIASVRVDSCQGSHPSCKLS